MHDFRRRPEDLKPEQAQALEGLFEEVPVLGVIYHLRWQATATFDTAATRLSAARALRKWIAEARAMELDWEPFIGMLERHWDGILAYFADRRTSGPVEGINNKARVIVKRAFGLKSADSLWTRLVLDLNRAKDVGTRTIGQIRDLVIGFRAIFS